MLCNTRVSLIKLNCDWLQQHSSLCHLGRGASFGDSVLDDSPRDSTALTRGQCKLLRVEQRDFRLLWEVRAQHNTFMFPNAAQSKERKVNGNSDR